MGAKSRGNYYTYTKDLLVSGYARRNGFGEEQVFHSPFITLVIWPLALLVCGGIFIAIDFWESTVWVLKWGIVPWYLLAGLLNNCFIVGKGEFIILNRNFPWWWTRRLHRDEIESVLISKSRIVSWLGWPLFLWGEGHYVKVKTTDGRTRWYFCHSLESDYYDENTLLNIIDDLEFALKMEGIKVRMVGVYDY